MPAKRIEREGNRYGKWTVVSFHSKYGACGSKWNCKCDCGTERVVIFGSLQGGKSTSCGCDAVQLRRNKLTKHGMAGTPTYKSWHQMHQRCAGKHGHDYYKNHGITVCDRWITFENFYEDMGIRPPGTTLDRINGMHGYSPENCRWATDLEQANNRKTCKPQIVFGEVLTPAQAARKYSKHISGVRHRLRKGFTLEAAISTPPLRALRDLDVTSCLEGAYEQIKDRKGTLMPDGTFVKHE